jgi:tetratricopeptide (TPR) repeat protein
VVVLYLGLILAPHRLNVDWDVPESTSLLDGWMWSSAAVIAAILAGAWFFYRMARHEVRHALFFSSVLWYFITLLPSSSIIPLPDVMADHRLYLPSIGVLTALVCAADFLRTEFFRNRIVARAVPIAVGCWVLGLCAATMVRNEVWRSGISLWADASLKSPNKFRPWGNLGVCYGVNGQLEEAKSCLKKAIGLKKDYNMGYRNLAIILTDQKKYSESIQTSIEGLRACGNDTMMHYNMAVAFCAMGRLNEGAAALQNALALSPNHFLSHFSLGDVYAKQAKYEEAYREYQMAGQLAPHDDRVPARIALIQSKTRSLAGN